ncbi:MAG: hypothetical protein JXA25_04895 [Anaerolineales bacterium]|nr:hypothetical protein [Anaerolineales bacterium]
MTETKELCLYHNDQDGCCAAAIVRRRFGHDVKLIPIDYGYPLPWEELDAAERVYIVDFSLPLEEMLRIQQHAELIWIDHHKSSLLALESLETFGLRAMDRAGCVLTWQTFYPEIPIPRPVMYIGERDIWSFQHEDTKPFCEGVYQQDPDPINDALWVPLLDDDEMLVAQYVEEGRLLLKARLREIQRKIDNYGFEVVFEGYRTLAINARGTGEIGEYVRSLGYEICYAFYQTRRDGELITGVTLYSDQVDVSRVAERFGGGGHEGASGFLFVNKENPFPPDSAVALVQPDQEG